MKRSLLIEIHPWRGFSFGRDLFVRVAVLGWITVAVAPGSILDRLRALVEKMRHTQ